MIVSIVTPSFRQLQWLKFCAASIADQEGVVHEHIVQDAGTGPELETWAQSVPNLSLYVEKDAGMYDAINRGLRRARGEICSYLNCDEQFLPGALKRVVSFFYSHPSVDVLFGDAILIDNSGNPISYRRVVRPTLAHARYVGLNAPTCTIFFRRSVIDRGFLFEPQWKILGDQVWMEKLLSSGIRTATLDEPLAVFTFTGENLSATKAAQEEADQRRKSLPKTSGVRKLFAIGVHRMRKCFAGAYRTRNVDIEIYTQTSQNSRERRHARVGFAWPAFIESTANPNIGCPTQ
jgi:glycosyltransferase involved in cell wall biosynthesis